MPNGFEEFAQNAMALGQRWREQRQQKQIAAAMGKFDTDPNAAIAGVTAADPITGWNMRRQVAADAEATQKDQRDQALATLKTVTGLLRPAAEQPGATPESIGQAYDALTPLLADGLKMQPADIAKWRSMITANPGIVSNLDAKLQVVPPGAAITRDGKEVYRNAAAPKTIVVRRGDGGSDVITIDPTTGQPIAGGGAVPSGAAAPTASDPTTADAAWAFTAKHEGGYNPHDANGAPVNFGVNQAANPGVDVANLTPEGAKQIFVDKYFNPSGAAGLPGPLGVMHADTYYINPKRAQQFLAQSGGDPEKYLQLRAQWQNNLVKNNPARFGKYANAWDSRNNDLAQMISGAGDANAAAPGGAKPIYSTPGKAAGGGAGHLLSDDEVSQAGLNPTVKWQYDHNGDIKMVGPASQVGKPQDVTKGQQQFDITQNALTRMKTLAGSLLQHPGLDRAAGVNSYFPSIHGGQAANFESALEALKAQIGLAIYQNQKQSSPTGSAGMRMTNFELQQMQRDIASLDLKQDPATLRNNIQKVITYADTMMGANQRARDLQQSRAAPAPKQGGTVAPPAAAIDMLRSNPSPQRRQQFDQAFGQGAAARFVATKPNNFSQKMPVGVTTPYGTRM